MTDVIENCWMIDCDNFFCLWIDACGLFNGDRVNLSHRLVGGEARTLWAPVEVP